MNEKLRTPAPPTLLLLVAGLQGGGAERQLSDMANYWAAKDWHVILATWSGPEVVDFYPLDARVQRVSLELRTKSAASRSRIRVNLGRIARLRRFLTSTRPDAVLSFMPQSNVLTILTGAGLNL